MAEALANLSPGGYDEEFVNEVEDDLQCAICQLALKDPMLTKCGHRFCSQCLDEHFKRYSVLWFIRTGMSVYANGKCPIPNVQLQYKISLQLQNPVKGLKGMVQF